MCGLWGKSSSEHDISSSHQAGSLYGMQVSCNNRDWSKRKKGYNCCCDLICSLYHQNRRGIWEKEEILSMCFILEEDQRRQSSARVLRGSKQMTDLRYLVWLWLRILCNNQKPLSMLQRKLKPVIYPFFSLLLCWQTIHTDCQTTLRFPPSSGKE